MTADQIVVALTGEQHVMVAGRAAATVAPQSVVAAKAKQRVAADSAIQTIASVAANQVSLPLLPSKTRRPNLANDRPGREIDRAQSGDR